jgi:hypothetical protein
LARLVLLLVEDLDRLPPRRLLAVVDLPKVEHLPLRRVAALQAARLDHAPVAVKLAVLLP